MFKLPNNSLNFFIFIPLTKIFFLSFISTFIEPSLSLFSYSKKTDEIFSLNFINSLSLLVLKDFPIAHKNIYSIIFVFPCALSP